MTVIQKDSTMPDQPSTFEQAMQELEEVVAKLEAGGLPLEETIALFERGQKLAAHCAALLDQAEVRLQQLRPAPDGGFESAPFDEGDDT